MGHGAVVENTFSQSELEAIAAALGDTSEGLTGPEIGHIWPPLKMSDPTPTMTKWKRLHNAFVERQRHRPANLTVARPSQFSPSSYD